MCTYIDKLELIFFCFPIQKNHSPFLLYLSPYCNPLAWPQACKQSEQEGIIFLYMEKRKKKIPACQNQVHNSPLISEFATSIANSKDNSNDHK